MKKTIKKMAILTILTFIIVILPINGFAKIEGGITRDDKADLTLIGATKGSTTRETIKRHNNSELNIIENDELDASKLTQTEYLKYKAKYDELKNKCKCINDNTYISHFGHSGCSLDDKWELVRCSAHKDEWEDLFELFAEKNTGYSYYTFYCTWSELKKNLGDWIDDANENYSIGELMDFLNSEQNEVSLGEKTGNYGLKYFSSFFCLKHGQAIGSFHGYFIKDHYSPLSTDFYTRIETTGDTYENYKVKQNGFTDLSETDRFDYMDEDTENETTRGFNSKVKYFLKTSAYSQSLNQSHNIYTVYNGYGTYNTNVFTYSAAYSLKYKDEWQGSNYKNERAQLGIWAVVGNPAVGEPMVDIEEGSVDEDSETTTSTDSVLASELYKCGAAVDEYEALLTENIEGEKATKHAIAVNGSNSDLRNNPEVFLIQGNSRVTEGSNVGEWAYFDNAVKYNNNEPTGTTVFYQNDKYYYRIGPFLMNDYALAKAKDDVPIQNYSGSNLTVYKKIIGGIVSGKVTLNNNIELTVGENAFVSYVDPLGNETYKGIASTGNYITKPTESEYPYPYPQSVFYIIVQKDLCGNATGLSNMSYEYRQTKSDGTGWCILSKYIRTTYKRTAEEISPCTYHCTVCYNNGIATDSRSAAGEDHKYYCSEYDNGTTRCQYGKAAGYGSSNITASCSWSYKDSLHTHSDGCYNDKGKKTCGKSSHPSHTDSCRQHTCTLSYCPHGHSGGTHDETCKSWGSSHIDDCKSETRCNSHSGYSGNGPSTNGHVDCYETHWIHQSNVPTSGQPFLAIRSAYVEVVKNKITSTLNVRLTTSVTIDKYIYKVEHTGTDSHIDSSLYTKYDNSFDSVFENYSRRDELDSEKLRNIIKLERGDKVTYNIDLENDSTVDVKVQIKDELPEYCEFKSIKNDNTGDSITYYKLTGDNSGKSDDSKYLITDWIVVNAGDTTTVKVEIIATASDAEITNINEATLVSGNLGDLGTDKDDDSCNYVRKNTGVGGALVNLAQLDSSASTNSGKIGKVLKSYDYYLVKSYNIVFDKYITEVKHVTTGEETYTRDKSANGKTTGKNGATKSSQFNNRDEYNDNTQSSGLTTSKKINKQKYDNPVYVEYGDRITYNIDIQNTWSTNNKEIDSSKSGFSTEGVNSKPYYAPNYINVGVTDTLPTCYQKDSLSIIYYIYDVQYGNDKNSSKSNIVKTITTYEPDVIENEDGTYRFELPNLYINPNSEATIEVSFIVNTNLTGVKYENNISLDLYSKNYNGKKGGEDYGETLDYDIRNINGYYVYNTPNKAGASRRIWSADYFLLNDYDASIDKYISYYDEKMLLENVENNFEAYYGTDLSIRPGKTDIFKYENPVSAEKTETVKYTIKVYNNAQEKIIDSSNGLDYYKPATDVRTSSITDTLDKGLTLVNQNSIIANIYDSEGKIAISGIPVTANNLGNNVFNLNIHNKKNQEYTVIEPGGYIEYVLEVRIDKSNMYLPNLENKAEINVLTDINNVSDVDNNLSLAAPLETDHSRVVTIRNLSTKTSSSDFIRLKDLIISGKVWLDFDKDGYMSAYNGLDDLGDKENSKVYEERFMKDIIVKLYSITKDGKITEERVTRTDENGLYTFARETESNSVYRNGLQQRVDKANNKDKNGNYTESSVYKEYYVEYEYDGVLYKSTEVYSGKKHLDAFGDLYDAEDGNKYVINGTEKYKLDSNAQDLIYVREDFNKKYQTISNNISYAMDSDGTTGEKGSESKDLEYTKDGHVSYLNTDYSRTMTARSFLYTYNAESLEKAYNTVINNCTRNTGWKTCVNHQEHWNILIDNDIINSANYEDDKDGREDAKKDTTNVYNEIIANKDSNGNTQITKYLWLYQYNANRPEEDHLPETEYLKYINLGLEEREDIDISLTKDVYEVKTTINGEEMIYSFDQLEEEGPDKLNGDIKIKGDYLQDYIIKQPYGLTLYEADFKYRYDQYKNQEVRVAKGTESELNIEVTYKITVDSKKIEVDEPNMADKDRELDVKVQEIMDIYDENFITFDGDEEQHVNVIEKTSDGEFLKEGSNKYKKVKVAEAWYYPNNDVTKDKIELDVYNYSKYSPREVDFSSDGYNTLYIGGMDDVEIVEGGKLDIYIKYVVEKDKNEEKNLERTLQIIEETINKNNERGLENIAQVNAYSVWYKDGKPASIVDCDSNVGNVGTRNNGADISVDHYQYYEDTAYKTGIEIKVPNYTNSDIDVSGITMTTEQIIKELQKIKTAKEGAYVCPHVYYTAIVPNWKNNGSTTAVFYITSLEEECSSCLSYGDIEWYLYRAGLIKANENHTLDELDDLINDYQDKLEEKLDLNNVMRKISGKVWDDSRSEEEDKQYHGNGEYSTADRKLEEAKLNENVSVNYENNKPNNTEEKDILVRNAKVEYVEIIPVKLSNGEVRYYEETLNANATDTKWLSVQNMRTDKNGKYELTGFIPGEYILRYTYGDDEGLKDMLIFNGHDYKSTTYTGVDDNTAYGNEAKGIEADPDKVIKTMEIANKSDARDDEIRRLETMAYSETMVSKKAEVLKGTANGTVESLKAEDTNTPEEYEELTDNTFMEADTVKFYVKPEKLKKLTDNPTRSYLQSTPYKHLLELGDEIIYSKLTDLIYDDTKVSERTYSIKNLDFGIEYRPETQITLNKAISGISLITSDGTTLVKLVLDTENFGQGSSQQNIIKSESIGLEYTQFVSNDYTSVDPYKLTSEAYQGFVFINVDDEILQGSTIEIEYSFVAENNSEIDRISQNLDDIRFRDNAATQANKDQIRYIKLDEDGTLYSDTANDSNKYVYSATGTASQILYDEYYAKYGSDEYRKEIQIGYEDYYGRYLGQTYYLGTEGDKDVIASVKFDKILDYVDTDLVFKSSTENDELWSATTDKDLLGEHPTRGLFIKKELFTADNRLVNSKGVNYVTYNIDKPLTSNLLISVDDRRKDADEYVGETDPTVNTGISRFLQPYLTARENSRGTIRIITSKVISAETNTDDMQYENLAEIIQYTSQTGRRTNFATTIGNANAATGEFSTAKAELDTSATEVITLTPPTGLDRVNRVVRDVVETTGKGIGAGAIIIAVVFIGFIIVRFTIKKIRKRPIK